MRAFDTSATCTFPTICGPAKPERGSSCATAIRESVQLHARAGEPKKLVVLRGYGHYEVYMEPAFSEVMPATLAWYRQYLPARGA